MQSYFNTSHVKVYRYCPRSRTLIYKDFNTSHVKVYPHSGLSDHPHQYFNTSHVKVYLLCVFLPAIFNGISIHLMLRFIRTKRLP